MRALRRFFDASFRRYAATSALATLTDFAFASVLHRLGSPAGSATFVGCVAGGGVAFALSRSWSFQAGSARALPQLLRFLWVWLMSAVLNSVGVPALLGIVASFQVAWIAVRGAVYLGWNYPMTRWFVFGRGRNAARLSAP
jgi:putative flippase GtrA